MVKNLPANARDIGLIPVLRDTLSSKWQHTPIFFPGKSHGQRSLASYSPWGRKRVGHRLAANQQQMLRNMNVKALFSLRGKARR